MAEENLIEAVREHRELYDTKHENYMKIKLKNRIWDDIAKNLNLKNGEEAKTFWLKLRGSYRDARRRQLKYMKSGAAPENIKPWRFQKQMSFLEPFMATGPREGNLNDDSDDDDDSQSQLTSKRPGSTEMESEEVEETNSHGNEGDEKSDVVINTEDIGEGSSSSRATEYEAPNIACTTPVSRNKQFKSRKQDDLRSLLKRSMQQREERARQRAEERKTLESTNTMDDPLYNFFISMYQLTKNMPPNYQHRVRGQLFQAVSQAEEEIMNITSRPPSTLSSPHSPHPSAHTWPDPQHQIPFHHSQQQQQSGNMQVYTTETGISNMDNYINRFQEN